MSQAVLGHLGVLLLFAHDAHVVCETVRCRCKLHCRMQCKAERLKGVGWRRNGLGLGSKDLVERNRPECPLKILGGEGSRERNSRSIPVVHESQHAVDMM